MDNVATVWRRLLNLVTAVSFVAALAVASSWIWFGITAGYQHLGFGRGHHTLSIDTEPSGFGITSTA